jgi:hypothetical protein
MRLESNLKHNSYWNYSKQLGPSAVILSKHKFYVRV